MTRRMALAIVLDHALRHCAGAGQGLRAMPTDKERLLVIAAARKLWRDAHDFELSENELFNRGLHS